MERIKIYSFIIIGVKKVWKHFFKLINEIIINEIIINELIMNAKIVIQTDIFIDILGYGL